MIMSMSISHSHSVTFPQKQLREDECVFLSLCVLLYHSHSIWTDHNQCSKTTVAFKFARFKFGQLQTVWQRCRISLSERHGQAFWRLLSLITSALCHSINNELIVVKSYIPIGKACLSSCTWSIFAARCYAKAAYAIMRCPSVRPSVTFVNEFCQNE